MMITSQVSERNAFLTGVDRATGRLVFLFRTDGGEAGGRRCGRRVGGPGDRGASVFGLALRRVDLVDTLAVDRLTVQLGDRLRGGGLVVGHHGGLDVGRVLVDHARQGLAVHRHDRAGSDLDVSRDLIVVDGHERAVEAEREHDAGARDHLRLELRLLLLALAAAVEHERGERHDDDDEEE
ncbi:hypothetical protein Cus16_0367 [Curtobacterium sp. ER1/6]|nr:hypothetical protein Cus16_0367 [Curtobacterium sp. ER1/6]